MSFKSTDDILAYAIDKEKEAVAFYKGLSTKDNFASVKETFLNFAGEEQKHVELLQGMVDNKSTIQNYEIKSIPDLKISDYLVDIEYEEGMFMNDIIRLAMKREEQAVKLYKDLASRSENPEVTKIFQILIQEESKHKLALESMYDDFLADNEN